LIDENINLTAQYTDAKKEMDEIKRQKKILDAEVSKLRVEVRKAPQK
jgi:cell division protein FtsB